VSVPLGVDDLESLKSKNAGYQRPDRSTTLFRFGVKWFDIEQIDSVREFSARSDQAAQLPSDPTLLLHHHLNR
jgi:hypothetical protein